MTQPNAPSAYRLPELPPPVDLETVEVLKALARANRALAELKCAAQSIPNQGILINTLAMQEAKASDQFEIFEYGFRADNSGLVQAKGSAEEADKQV